MDEVVVMPVAPVGVKELKEALIGVNELAIFLAIRMKDGIGIDDAMAIWTKLQSDADFKMKMEAAYNGISAAQAELKDMDLSEGMELAMIQLQYVPQLIAALKKA